MSDMFMVVVIAEGKVQQFHCQVKKNVAVQKKTSYTEAHLG